MADEASLQINIADPDGPASEPGPSEPRESLRSGTKKNRKTTENEESPEKKKSVFLPGKAMKDGEVLVCDKSVYYLFEELQAGSPCLSFDIVRDSMGEKRVTYPMSACIVAGTQADHQHDNNLLLLKLGNMHQTEESLKKRDDETEDSEESSDESSDEEVEESTLSAISVKHKGCVNRVRATCVGARTLVASWSEVGSVFIWDVSSLQAKLCGHSESEELQERADGFSPVFSFSGHLSEGFAVDWSPTVPGNLLTGDCRNKIHLWKPSNEANTWNVDQRPFSAHTGSVEDIQWSPSEASVFASCSVDKSVRVWDVRAQPHKACMITVSEAHTSDANVISWNRVDPFIVSGGDDGVLNVWDLREISSNAPTPIASFKHHSAPITTVEWNCNDPSVFASGGEDDQIALWDIACEKDDADGDVVMDEVPPQLLFIHQGQEKIKELHWHPQIPGLVISTALSGFNLFKSISV
ncbi:unnamed protein product [Notodromas monacha]|uniref:Glutamate-rich WD repeat-containing protein 1 n=1 Tax=Notodromas monacha TaxID=399045 RepID=A0A7R9BSU9_9CRUS|nr:unnamed protein product [Notodromas monacha]CAG0920058.1 unnamed protein product [Notodromas monacha]